MSSDMLEQDLEIALNSPRRAGFLTKVGYQSGKWQRRWFVLDFQGHLTYHNNPNSRMKGKIIIDEKSACVSVEAGSPVGQDGIVQGAKAKPAPEYCLKLTAKWKQAGERAFYLAADTEESKVAWMEDFNSALQVLGSSRRSVHESKKSESAAEERRNSRRSVISDSGKQPLPEPPAGCSDSALPVFPPKDSEISTNKRISLMHDALMELEELHLPEGLCGFVVTEDPLPGTQASKLQFKMYDFIYEFEGERIDDNTTMQAFSMGKAIAFAQRGEFVLGVYNFSNQEYRVVRIPKPEDSSLKLGLISSGLPVRASKATAAQLTAAAPDEALYVKGWRKHGEMLVSAGSRWYPLQAPLTSENEDIYVQVYRQVNSVFTRQATDYHLLYQYDTLEEPLFVEVWRKRGDQMIQGSPDKYGALPTTRE